MDSGFVAQCIKYEKSNSQTGRTTPSLNNSLERIHPNDKVRHINLCGYADNCHENRFCSVLIIFG